MNKYTIRVSADKLQSVIPIPPEFQHREVEVSITLPGRKKFDPRKYRAIGNETKADIDNELANMRREWE